MKAINSYDAVYLEAHENYNKGTFRNKCEIVSATGKLLLSIPLSKGKHQKMPIQKVEINYDFPWQRNHWQSIKTAYGKSPFWEFYFDEIKELYFAKEQYLFEFNLKLLKKMNEFFQIKTDLQLSKQYDKSSAKTINDLRNTISPKRTSSNLSHQPYTQVFQDRLPFQANASCLDVLFCLGPEAPSIFS